MWVVLPSFNEGAPLQALVEDIHRVLAGLQHHIVLVDDGSTDGSADWLTAAPDDRLTLLRHGRNRGLGRTLNDGLLAAVRHAAAGEADVVVVMDADGSHRPDDIPRLLQALEGHAPADVVVASRYRRGSRVKGLAWHRQVFSLGAAVLFQAFVGVPGVRDYTCGFRAYRLGALWRLFLAEPAAVRRPGFGCMAELLVALHRQGAGVCEIPFALRYDLKESRSKLALWDTICETLGLLADMTFRRHVTPRTSISIRKPRSV